MHHYWVLFFFNFRRLLHSHGWHFTAVAWGVLLMLCKLNLMYRLGECPWLFLLLGTQWEWISWRGFAYKNIDLKLLFYYFFINNMKLWKNRSAKVKSQWTDCCFDRHMCCICNVFSFTAFLPFFSCFPLFIPLTLPSSSSFSSPAQYPSLCHCWHQPPPVEPGLWDNPIGLSGGEGRARLLSNVGSDGGDSSYFPSAATPQSHVPEQLRRPPQPGTQGMTDGSISTYI